MVVDTDFGISQVVGDFGEFFLADRTTRANTEYLTLKYVIGGASETVIGAYVACSKVLGHRVICAGDLYPSTKRLYDDLIAKLVTESGKVEKVGGNSWPANKPDCFLDAGLAVHYRQAVLSKMMDVDTNELIADHLMAYVEASVMELTSAEEVVAEPLRSAECCYSHHDPSYVKIHLKTMHPLYKPPELQQERLMKMNKIVQVTESDHDSQILVGNEIPSPIPTAY
ncbi:hypothetical protein BV898_03346 [Hypsibius exemplaris]|uniref:Uncharacterized protein n=1 Tax=Hypsibius exemplaris TaxID=2072580 RepID=A0A1W0X6D8_HYPEX|nr:hypothetical protein BV898_03346 [Hypsibius exemplaris]